jgi:hypothetical protein
MSGMTVVIEEAGDESIAKRVIQTSRELYAKKAEPAYRVLGRLTAETQRPKE